MIEINRHKFAKNNDEFMSSLFETTGTCHGYYRQYKDRIIFESMQHKPFAALLTNRHGNHFVSCSASTGRMFYSFALSTIDEKLFGLADLSYSKQRELIDTYASQHLENENV